MKVIWELSTQIERKTCIIYAINIIVMEIILQTDKEKPSHFRCFCDFLQGNVWYGLLKQSLIENKKGLRIFYD